MTSTRLSAWVLLALVHSGCVVARAPGGGTGYGEVRFENSGAALAQDEFLNGLGALHNFEYRPAATHFLNAQEIDRGFAMAYWGEAMTHTHPIWMEQDLDAGRRALQRLGPTPETRLSKASTEREKAFLRAIDLLYGDGDKQARDLAYADAMTALARTYADDIDAAAFAALAILGTAHQGRDEAISMRAAAIIEPLIDKAPRHPGLRHYLIHAYDDPAHAPKALDTARAYSRIAGPPHAQHMSSHIFVAMGLWDEVVDSNESAVRRTQSVAAPNRPPTPCGHYSTWLHYGYLQQGRYQKARRLLLDCHAAATTAGGNAWAAFAAMRARHLIDTEHWTGDVTTLAVPEGSPEATFTHEYTNAFVALRRGNLSAGRAALGRLARARQALMDSQGAGAMAHMGGAQDREWRRLEIMQSEIAIMLGAGEGAAFDAIDRLEQLAPQEDALPFEVGPPMIDKPTWELLGDMYLDVVDVPKATAAYERALKRAPRRVQPLIGLLKAARLSDDATKRAEIKSQLDGIRHRADPDARLP